jgi:hypothetical protein
MSQTYGFGILDPRFKIRDPRSRRRKKPIPDPGSGSKGQKCTGSQISYLDLQPCEAHWNVWSACFFQIFLVQSATRRCFKNPFICQEICAKTVRHQRWYEVIRVWSYTTFIAYGSLSWENYWSKPKGFRQILLIIKKHTLHNHYYSKTILKVPKCEILISWILMIFLSWSLYR